MLHYTPQHISSNTLLIIRRTNCITTASGIVTLHKQPYTMQVESGLQSALHLHAVIFDVFYMFRTRRFMFRKAVVYTVMARCILHESV